MGLVIGLTLTCVARSHEPYTTFYSSGVPGLGKWCCSGSLDGSTGDCSPADFHVNRDGSAYFTPRKYPQAKILVAAHRILWTRLPDPEAAKFDGHWCGFPRGANRQIDRDEPDQGFLTICAAIAPGGT